MEYEYRPRYQEQALEAVAGLGEIEFLIEESEEESESETDEEELAARREIEANTLVSGTGNTPEEEEGEQTSGVQQEGSTTEPATIGN